MVICLPWDNIDNPWWEAGLLHKLGHGKATVGHFPRSCHLFQDLHLSGVCSASFITTVLPVAKAGPSFQAWGEMMILGRLGPGESGPGHLGPGQLGPGQLGPGPNCPGPNCPFF